MTHRLPNQRWKIAPMEPKKVNDLVTTMGLSPLLAQVLINRDIETTEQAQVYIEPETETLPPPVEAFPDLAKSVELLKEAIASEEKISICGDYDADGMTSTALLLRALRHFGATVDYEIPSRMKDGYGINKRIVEKAAASGVGVILTVDNGISAYDAIFRAVELGLTVIITDHHDLPETLPPADAILNPKLIPESSPYRGLAGVGVAYILAVTLGKELGLLQGLTKQLLELFTLGTIADLAPLVGVNRRWLKRGLRSLPQSEIPGVQALMQMAGVSDEQKTLRPDDIGFKLGPRINAIGRISDPTIVIDLLTTDHAGIALEKAMRCEQENKRRQDLCEEIEQDAIALIEGNIETGEVSPHLNWYEKRVLLLVQKDWHHGVIGIVASRLVERYGVPVFIATYEEDDPTKIRGSARSIPEFHIFEALDFCQDLLGKYGGHKAAGGFSLAAQNLAAFGERLSEFAHSSLEVHHLKPLVNIDAQANLDQLTASFYKQIDSLHPWGIGNSEPIFWTPNVRILEQQMVGKNHIKLTLTQDSALPESLIKGIAWRWGEYFPLPSPVDIAYKLRENHWNGNVSVELEIVGVRAPSQVAIAPEIQKAQFEYQGRTYACSFWESLNELRIKNEQGKVLAVTPGQATGLLGTTRETAMEVNVSQAHYSQLISAALVALKGSPT